MTESMTHPLEEPGISSRFVNPCILVIFGATGDLTARKLFPAIYNLTREGQLPSQFACVAFARRDKTNEQFRKEMHDAINEFSRVKPIDESIWNAFKEVVFYHRSEFHEDEGYERLAQLLNELDVKFGTKGNRAFYLSTQPKYFTLICEKLHQHGLIYDKSKESDKWSRVIIEKPFGHDLDSALALQKELTQFLHEDQIFRIDHYLGKETVQNLLVFRFDNALFEPLWNNNYIDHVQITVAEDIGIGTRGAFFEEAGILRDVLQNHMMQLVSLVAMEPPSSLKANTIRDEKVKVLRAIRHFSTEELESAVVAGQYGKGLISGQEVKGYREEQNVDKNSTMETYVAMRLFIDNPRWHGVPFYLRCGKRLPKKATEIAITFKQPSEVLFQRPGTLSDPNVLAIRIQPDEGTSLKMNCKVPGQGIAIQPVKMDFRYGSYFGIAPPEAYERLILDFIIGDSTLFARADEVEQSWQILSPVLDYWQKHKPSDFPNYPSGTWGPKAADVLIEKDKRRWRLL